MYDSNSKGISYTAGFFILIAFAVAGLIFGSLISLPIWSAMTGETVFSMKDELDNPAYSNAFKAVQAVSTFFGFLIPAFFSALILNRKPLRLLGFTKKLRWRQAGLVIAIMFLALFISQSMGYLNQHIPLPATWKTNFQKLEDEYNNQVEAIMQLKGFGDFLLGILIMAFLPALCEESLFRGGLQNYLSRATKNPWLAILLVSALFSIVHLSFYGFLPRMFLGLILGLIFYYTESLWLCILAHFFNNAISVSQFYFTHASFKQMAQENPSLPVVFLGFFLIPFIIGLLIVLKRVSPKQKNNGLTLDEIRDKAPWETDN